MSLSAGGGLPITVTVTPGAQDVTIIGRIDVRTVPDIRLVLHDLVDTGGGDLRLHLGAAEIGDATGLGVLVEAYTRARRAGRRLAVVDMTERTDRLLRASRLDRALVVRERPARAVAPAEPASSLMGPATVSAVTA